MTRLAPTTTGNLTPTIKKALNLLGKVKDSDAFPVIEDKNNELNGNYLAAEAKHVLTAIMVSGLWDKLCKVDANLPHPGSQQAGFRISTLAWWPTSNTADGIVGHAADQQSDFLADLAFTKLMYAANKNMSKAHADLLKVYEANKPKSNKPTTPAGVGAGSSAEYGVAGPSTAPGLDVTMGDADDENDDDENNDDENNDDDELAELTADGDLASNALPAAWREKKTHRATRDSALWPSAGELPHEISNIQQAQYSIMTDTLWEQVKVQVIKQKRKTGKKLTGETNHETVELADDPNAQNVYFDLLDRFKKAGYKLLLTTSKNAKTRAGEFAEFVRSLTQAPTNYDVSFVDVSGNPQKLDAILLNRYDDDALTQFFVRACKVRDKNRKGQDDAASATTLSIADDQSLLGTEYSATPAPEASGSSVRARGKAPSGRAVARGGLKPSSKRARTIEDSEDEAEEEEEEEAMSAADLQARIKEASKKPVKKTVKKAKTSEN